MLTNNQVSRVSVVTPPTSEPLSLAEAKRQVYVASSDTYHDEDLVLRIQAAREQWEHDTDSAVMQQTLKVTLEYVFDDEIYLPRRPVQSISSIKYYDQNNSLQTLDSSVYSLDAAARAVRLNYNSVWPSVYSERFDAVTVEYVAGYANRQNVPAIAKQAMLLLVGYYWESNRGDNDKAYDLRAYERLVARFMRSTYP